MKCWFFSSTSLTTLRELNHIVLTLHHMFTLVEQLAWVNVGEGCYFTAPVHHFRIALITIENNIGVYYKGKRIFLPTYLSSVQLSPLKQSFEDKLVSISSIISSHLH